MANTPSDHDFARAFWSMARLAKEPAIQQLSKELKAAKPRKPEWGRPVNEYIRDVVSPDYYASMTMPSEKPSLVIAAVECVQSTTAKPTCETFKVLLGLMREPTRLPMLNHTRILPACVQLLREHVKNTEEPILRYEYGYLCWQLIVLTVEIALLLREDTSGWEHFVALAHIAPSVSHIPATLSNHTLLQIHLNNRESPRDGISDLIQPSRTPHGRRTYLPTVGGFMDLDSLFLVQALWDSRKDWSFIAAKARVPGWLFPLRLCSEHLLEQSVGGKNAGITWGYLANLCQRYGLVVNQEELPAVADMSNICRGLCTDDHHWEIAATMVDTDDARIIVESYIARMTPKHKVEPLSIPFCSDLVDFVFREDISTLGHALLIPLIKVGYKRVWVELADEQVTRDVDWCVNIARCIVNNMGSTERVFAAEHRFKPAEIEAFLPALRDVDVIGFLGQALLMPTILPPDPQVDQAWVLVVKRVISFAQTLSYSKSSTMAAKMFAEQYADWSNTLHYIRTQILNNPYKDESMRGNASGAELAWTNVGKIFGFEPGDNQKKVSLSRGGTRCASPRCTGAIERVNICERCLKVRYCSQGCQSVHWNLHTADSHWQNCVQEG